MGYMTVVSILNDAWHNIKENPKAFIENISKGMQGEYGRGSVQHYPIQGYANPMEVRRAFHSSQSVLLLVGQNHMEDVEDFDPNRNNDFHLAYKARVMNAVEDKLDYARCQLEGRIAHIIYEDMCRRNLDKTHILEVAETYESFKALPRKSANHVVKNIENLFKD